MPSPNGVIDRVVRTIEIYEKAWACSRYMV